MDNVGEFVAIQAAEKRLRRERQWTPEMNCSFPNMLNHNLDSVAV